ncbi:MAG TPA: hypothetical protein PLV85_25530, partial [Polyangiaceae bacterium]|nr:hypothetical protein [Polyangiaceae bacterium]
MTRSSISSRGGKNVVREGRIALSKHLEPSSEGQIHSTAARKERDQCAMICCTHSLAERMPVCSSSGIAAEP